MAYYYVNGVKQPVDDNSTPEEKQAAYEQEQQDLAASRGDPSTNGDPNGVKPPDNSGTPTIAPNGGIMEVMNPTISPAEQAKENAVRVAEQKAAAAAAADEQYKAHYQYGGWAGGAAEAANRYAKLGSDAQGRQGAQINTAQTGADRGMNLGARGQSVSMAGLLAARANGSMPSIAGMRANQDIGRALADQSSIAAGARGPGGLALAQQQQANNSAAAMGNISNSAQINTAQEQLNNTVAAGNAFNNVRQGDTSLQGLDSQQATAQAQLNQNQAAENDRYQLGMTGYETGVQGAQLQAQGNQIAGERGAYVNQQGIDLAHDQNTTAKTGQVLGVIGGVGGGVAAGVTTALLGGSKTPSAEGGAASGNGADTGTVAGGNGAAAGNDASGGAGNAGASSGDGSGATSVGQTAGDPGQSSSSGPWIAPQIFPPKPKAATPASPFDPNNPKPTSDANAKVPTSLSTTHDETKGPASSSVSMARMFAARDADAERNKSADTYSGLVGGVIRGLGQAFASPAPVAHIAPVTPQMQPISVQGATLSDDHTKLAAAWDQGHNDALDKVQQYRQMSPDDLKALGTKGNRLANAVRGAKADAYDEAQGSGGPIMQPSAPPRQMQSFQRNDADYGPPPPPPPADPQQGPLALSDASTKLSMSSMLGGERRNVGTLGKEVSREDVSDLARSMRSTPYAYKDPYAAREGQKPGEVNVGPVAQEMEKSRIGATIVKPDAQGSGMRTLDQTKMVKGLGAVAASHQDQLDEHDRTLSLMARRFGGMR